MSFSWKYPILLIRHGGGYASVVDEAEAAESPDGDTPDSDQSIVVFTSEAAAFEFMERTQLIGQLSELNNAREFKLLLECLKPPVRHVAVDPCPVEQQLHPKWTASVAQLIDELVIDYSPWNYPAYVIAEKSGYASIEGEGPVVALALFTTEAKADNYRDLAALPGAIEPLENMASTRELLVRLSATTVAVAIDPEIKDGAHTAKYCLSISSLLERYLVQG